jgi:predicted DNA-binding transcriptional regulator AlpA
VGRLVDIDLLIGAEEIARRLGVAAFTVYNWRKRGLSFPEPVFTMSRVAVWYWPDVEAWATETGRLPVVEMPKPRRRR